MQNYVDPNSAASTPGDVRLSRQKFVSLRDEILNVGAAKKIYYNKQFNRIYQYLQNGDTQPALVVSVSPLIISAYSDEMDAVVFLKFPDALAEKYNLQMNSRLVTANIYFGGTAIAPDIIPGSDYLNQYVNFTPVVQLFLCDNESYIKSRPEMFDEDMWDRVKLLSDERAAKKVEPRDGFYYFTEFNLLFMIF